MALDPNEKKSQSLRRGLILSLIGLQLVTVLLILFTTHFSTNQGINEQISVLLKNALNESKLHARGFLEPSYRAVQSTADLLQKQALNIDNLPSLEAYFLSQLQNNPEMNGIYLAKPQGDFYFVTRSDTDDEKTGFLTKVISADDPGKASFYSRDESLAITETRLSQKDDYQATERPWYRLAVDKGSVVWTEPYIFYTAKKPGITVAAPLYDSDRQLMGVIGIDVELTSLSRFLADLKVYGDISVFMVSNSGNFVAAPPLIADDFLIETLSVSDNGETQLLLDQQAATHFLKNADQQPLSTFSSYFDFNDQTHVVRYEPFILNQGPEWIIGAYAPQSVFLSEIRAGEQRNTLIALGILILSLIIGWFLIKKTWQPFERFFHDVITDQLTGLFNRRFLENVGSRMYIRLLRDHHESISIAVIDLDRFRKINHEFGHSKGNEVLVAFANFLQQTLRPEDIITRYSGDKFVVIFPGMNHDCAVSVVDRMRKQLDVWPLSVGDLLVRLTFSAGVETIDKTNRIADAAFSDFISVAERALRDAKAHGRDRVISANAKNYVPENIKIAAEA